MQKIDPSLQKALTSNWQVGIKSTVVSDGQMTRMILIQGHWGKIMSKFGKQDIIDSVATATDFTKADATRIYDSIFDFITDRLKNGDQVALPGFGSFDTSERAARKGRNPQTGETIDIAAQTVAKFKAAKALKEAVNA